MTRILTFAVTLALATSAEHARAQASAPVSSAAASALELVRVAREAESSRDDPRAVRRYMEALSLDPTCADAYLGLGALRARLGDLREAERVYTVALEHAPHLAAARRARAFVRRALGAREEATADLLAGGVDPATLRVLASWHTEDGQMPAALATWRRIVVAAEADGDEPLARQARATVRALVILVGPADPAASPPVSSAATRGVRDIIAALARRGG